MRLANYEWNMVVSWQENTVPVIVLEDPVVFRTHLRELMAQFEGIDGGFVLSKDLQPVDIAKHCLFFPEPLTTEINDKTMQAALTKWLKQEAVCEHFFVRTQEMQTQLLSWMYEIMQESEEALCFESDIDLAQMIKLCNVRFEGDECDLPEKLFRKMRIAQSLLKRNCFIFVNLHHYLSTEELKELYQAAHYRKMRIMVVENHCPETRMPEETLWIIDKDHCEIYPDMI